MKTTTRKQKPAPDSTGAGFANETKILTTERNYSTPQLSLQPQDCKTIRRWMIKISDAMATGPENYDNYFAVWNCLFSLLQRGQGFASYRFPGDAPGGER